MENGKNNTSANFVLPRELDDYLNAIIMANTHRSRSEIVRDALKHYIEHALDPNVRNGANAIIRARRRTLFKIENEEVGFKLETKGIE